VIDEISQVDDAIVVITLGGSTIDAYGNITGRASLNTA
jgi:hypothetical protein